MRIKVNDTVEVISGNFKGVRGTVQRVYPGKQMVVVSGVNIVKKHQKARPTGGRSRAQGGIIEFESEPKKTVFRVLLPIAERPRAPTSRLPR